MARINFNDELFDQEEIDDYPPKKRRRKRRAKKIRPKTCCGLFFLIAFAFFLVIALAILARTGIVEIPFFSPVFYRLPQPSRQIEIDSQDLAKLAQNSLNVSLVANAISVEITEEQLTFLIRQALTGKEDSFFAESSQALIDKEGIEFYGLLRKPVLADITFKLRPYLAGNKLEFELVEAKIGALSVPPSLAGWLFDFFFKDGLSGVNQSLAKIGNLESLELEKKKLIIKAELN